MKRIPNGLIVAVLILVIIALLEGPANAASVCPAVGADTDCGTIITITNNGATTTASVTSTGQGPYDGIDDTLLGVINNSGHPIQNLGLTSGNTTSGNPIFGFDGDGIVSYGIAGNAQDSTGYGGPNAYFTGISSGQSGIVNFISPVASNGGMSYFSLENALSQPHTCAEVVNNSISAPVGGGTSINSTFTPNFGYTVAQAAVFCGVTDFDWQQTITNLPRPSPFLQVGNPNSLAAPPPFNDPPPGGYTYESPPDNSYPFYLDPTSGELASFETATTVNFSDNPSDPCLPGGTGAPCGGMTAPAGSTFAFSTHLVGVKSDRTPLDLGIGFTWYTTYNGTSGGIAATKNFKPVDLGSGTGGITVTSVQNTTNYQYNGVVVTIVNGNPIGPSTVFLPVVVNQSTNALQGSARPILPVVGRPPVNPPQRVPVPDKR